VRSIIGKTPNTTVLMDEVSDVDPEKRIVQTTSSAHFMRRPWVVTVLDLVQQGRHFFVGNDSFGRV
jgi:hypothetical protein